MLREEAEWLRASCGEGALLEVGCGTGRLLGAAAFLAAPIVGMDLVPRYLLAAMRRVAGVAWVAGDALAAPLRPGRFATVVVAQAVVGTVGGSLRRPLIAAAGDLVAPGGRLLVTAYGRLARQARREWYEAQQRHGLLPRLDRPRTRGGRFVFANGFVSAELTAARLDALRPRVFRGEARTLPSGLLAAAWSRSA